MRIATHDGSFHADDVFAVAALLRLHPAAEVIRSRDADALASADVRVDVGRRADPAAGTFDHHQPEGGGERPDGIRYASFGLVWRSFGERLAGSAEAAAEVDRILVAPVDAHDTGQTLADPRVEGVHAMTVSHAVAAFNPRWDEPDDERGLRARFDAAVSFAAGVLDREIAGAETQVRANGLVRAAIARAADPRLVELDRSLPWRKVVVTEAPEARFVLYPKREGWGLQAVPRALGAFANRLDLPATWAGRSGTELAELTRVADAEFCHAARFLVVARSREGIDALARLALAEEPAAAAART